MVTQMNMGERKRKREKLYNVYGIILCLLQKLVESEILYLVGILGGKNQISNIHKYSKY